MNADRPRTRARKGLAPVNPGVRIWRFARAPKNLRKLFPGAVDKDWIARTPSGFTPAISDWLHKWHLTYKVNAMHQLPDGGMVFLGSLEFDESILDLLGPGRSRATQAGGPV